MSQIRLDDLVGTKVRDASGRPVGRIFEIRAEEQGGDLVIVEYHLGPHALAERLGLSILKLIGLSDTPDRRKVAWTDLDISDPSRPILR
jgi:hypothetical protein